MTVSPINVWVVEDNHFLRDTIVELLDAQADLSCMLAVATAEQALDFMTDGQVAQVILMDLGLPGMSGVEAIRRINAVSPSTRLIVLTVNDDDEQVFDALCAGATGYLLKPAGGDQILEAIRTAMGGGAPMNAHIARKVIDAFAGRSRQRDNAGLTPREHEILERMVEEKTQKQIAQELSLSPHTVDTHLRNIYAKLQVHSRSGAVAKALRDRLI